MHLRSQITLPVAKVSFDFALSPSSSTQTHSNSKATQVQACVSLQSLIWGSARRFGGGTGGRRSCCRGIDIKIERGRTARGRKINVSATRMGKHPRRQAEALWRAFCGRNSGTVRVTRQLTTYLTVVTFCVTK